MVYFDVHAVFIFIFTSVWSKICTTACKDELWHICSVVRNNRLRYVLSSSFILLLLISRETRPELHLCLCLTSAESLLLRYDAAATCFQ